MKKNKTKSIAFSGIATSVIIILLFLAGIIEVLDYTACAICSLVVTFILVEFGTSSALGVYIASSILALLILPSKISTVLFIAFCGWYSFVKRYIERIKQPFEIILKLLLFNIVLCVIFAITKFVFMIENDSNITLIILLVICNVTFLIYDKLITKLIWLYTNVYRKKLSFLK